MKATKAIQILQRRIDYLEKKCLPARLVGQPWKSGEMELEAIDLAILALQDAQYNTPNENKLSLSNQDSV